MGVSDVREPAGRPHRAGRPGSDLVVSKMRRPLMRPGTVRRSLLIERLARGDSVDPALYYFRTVMRFETADPAVDWLNRILAIARGQREARAVRLDVYEVE